MDKYVVRFEYALHQYLDNDGNLIKELPESIQQAQLVSMYRWITLTRRFDQKAIALQRTGQLGTYASCLGQEAFSAAIGLSMNREDCLAPYYRDQAAQLIRGVAMHELLAFWGGHEKASLFADAPAQDFTNCIPIATQITHATGAALAMQLQQRTGIVVCSCGDGATSRGDFYESLNFAAIKKLPLVLVVNNNQWAISVPFKQQSATETIAQKAIASGIHAHRTDGNDALACLDVCQQAFEHARQGQGPVLIEMCSYRLCDHTTADDASRYRDDTELQAAWERCPIKRLNYYLQQQDLWSEEKEQEWQQHCEQKIDKAVQTYLNMPVDAPRDIMQYLYAELPYPMQEQYQLLLSRHGDQEEDVA